MTLIRLATRTSPLALVQTRHVAALLEERAGVSTELVPVETGGDRRLDLPIRALGGEGVFVAEVEIAVLERRADIAVHSAKDLPSGAPIEGLVLAATPERVDPRDALVGCRLDELAPGAIVATGSVRRRAQLAWIRPDLGYIELRGNIETRLDKVPAGGAAVVAQAALVRLGLTGRAAEVLPIVLMLPQVGQGALALRCRDDDEAIRAICSAIDDPSISRAVRAERAFLAALGGGCDAPVGAYGTTVGETIRLEALIAGEDGHGIARGVLEGADPERLGTALAGELLDDRGGRALLADSATR